MPSPAASRNSCAYGSLISGSALWVSFARPPATPNAVAPTLSLMSHVSSSVLAIGIPSLVSVKEAERTSPVVAERHRQGMEPPRDRGVHRAQIDCLELSQQG